MLNDFTISLGIFTKRFQGIFAYGHTTSSPTSTSREAPQAQIRDFHAIPFYGTQEPEEYLEWERLMDDYLNLHQVPPEDQVKCATMNFHDYASTWWLHAPSEIYDMSLPKTKRALQQEFVPQTYTEQLQRQLENTIRGS